MKVYIVASALLYALAINYASLLWPLIIIFPIPLFFAALNKQLNFTDGFLWGVIFFSVHLHDIAYTIFAMGDGASLLRIIPGLFIIFYMALYSAMWFWCTQKIINVFEIKKTPTTIFVWTLTLWVYVCCIDQYSLWIFNRTEGYPLAHPLLTLVHKPHLLTLLPIISKPFLTLLLLFAPATIFLCVYTKKKKWFFILLLVCIPWIMSPFFFKKENQPKWINTVTYLPIVFPKGTNTQAMINGAAHDIKKILFYKPKTEIIILPESSFYCDDLCNQQKALQVWNKKHLGKKVHIIVGAFRKTKNNYYNCLYWIYDGKLQTYCDKHHAMPLIEKLPNWFAWNWLKKTYFTGHTQLTIAQAPRPKFALSPKNIVVPYICSELYFNERPDDKYLNFPIILASNDRWFSPAYVPELLLRSARLKAVQWHRIIIYCSFYYGTVCSPNGQIW